MLKRIISSLLLVCVLMTSGAMAISCANGDGGNTNSTTAGGNVADEVVAPTGDDTDNRVDRASVSDDLPVKDFGGAKFNIVVREHEKEEFYVESEVGEVVNDAIYYRNKSIEERFNVVINPIPTKGSWDDQNIFMNLIKKTVQAGDPSFDLVAGYAAYITQLATNGMLINWNDVPYVNFDKPWWSQDSAKEMDVNGHLYFVTGDLSLTMWKYLFVLYFNKQLVKDYGLDDLYTTVQNGEWTLEKMIEVTKAVTQDYNGDGKMDDQDLYGYVTDSHNLIDVYHAAFEVPVTVKNAAGEPEIAITSTKYIESFTKLYNFIRQTPSTFVGTEQTGFAESVYRPMFEDGRALILPEYLGNVTILRNLEIDFGIIPFPKLDAAQTNYRGTAQDGYSLFCVPASAPDMEKLGIITEALCAESYKQVIPAYYDIALKTKFARDNESSAMIDLIRDGLSFNFGTVNSTKLDGPGHIWRSCVTDIVPDIVSAVDKKINPINSALNKMLEAGYR